MSFPLFLQPDDRGRLNYPEDVETSVRRSIQIILSTAPGELLMRPDFGAGLENYLDQPNDLVTRRRIKTAIEDSLTRWEDRIVLDRVQIQEQSSEPGRLRIEIAYRIRRTGSAASFGLTLGTGG